MIGFRALLARTIAVATLTVLGVLAAATTPSGAQTAQDVQPYIVVLKSGAVTSSATVAADHSAQFGIETKGVYRYALKGYSADLTAQQVAQLQADSLVAEVVPDTVYQIAVQTVPTGIRRIFADDNPNLDIDGQDDARIDVDVAVLDTGSGPHPDLNVVSRANCSSGSCQANTGNDDNGHGTHVAGTIGAIDNQDFVVGVAPGARLHSVKVCNSGGSCSSSAIAAGIDYITARAGTIEVTNVSLGGPGSNSAVSQAITNSVNAGVVYAVAAGNSDQNASGFFPASHPDVITVSALADFNGEPGGGAGSTCRADQDDTLADFSNWGATVEITAPGTCILSTWLNNGTNTISGTSMATPHVAGAAGVLASGTRDPTNRTQVLAIRQKIMDTGNLNWTDDSGDGVKERLLDVHDPAQFPGGGTPPPPPTNVFTDDFETARGWTTNFAGSDTATTGAWERGDPQATSSGGTSLQQGTTTSGVNDLSTARLAGASVGANDVDGGVTTIRSPQITLPSTGTISLSTRWYLAHLSNATSADFFRIRVLGSTNTVVFQQLGSAAARAGTWGTATANLSQFAGQTIRIQIEAADAGTASLIEAGLDDFRITRSA